MKKIQKLLLLLLMMAMLLPTFAMAETPVIVNLVENPDAEYHFEDGAKILEIVFPRVYSSDCILLRYDGMVMMIDASTKNATMRNRIYTACDTLGIDHIDNIFKYPHHGQVRLRDDFLEAINPQLIFINGAANVIKGSVNYCDKKHISYLLGYKGLTRMRTDGNIWVIDYLKEKNADRDLPYTPERDE